VISILVLRLFQSSVCFKDPDQFARIALPYETQVSLLLIFGVITRTMGVWQQHRLYQVFKKRL
jgi:hypothetical protein